jgi:nicotinamide mononucleotide (NMN) deamidase PncC
MLPTFSVGAAYAIEAAFVAYVQEIFSVALEIQQAHEKTHSKVTAKCCQAAADIVNKRISAATGFVPEAVSFRKAPKQKKASQAKGTEGKEKAKA